MSASSFTNVVLKAFRTGRISRNIPSMLSVGAFSNDPRPRKFVSVDRDDHYEIPPATPKGTLIFDQRGMYLERA